LRTQHVIAAETGVTNVADPLGGAWYVEELTDRLEAEAEAIFTRIRSLASESEAAAVGGAMTAGILRGIEDGWFTSEIADSAFTYQTKLEKGDKQVVGVNVNTSTIETPLEILRVSHDVERDQRSVLADRRARRNPDLVESTLRELTEVARSSGNLVPPMLAACRAEVTLGEICNTLRDEWGSYVEPARF